MKKLLLMLLAALLLAAGVDYSAYPPVYSPHVYDSDLTSGALVGATTGSELTPITVGSNLLLSGGTLSATGGITCYTTSGGACSTAPTIVVGPFTGTCSTGSGTPSKCNVSLSWSTHFTSTGTFGAYCIETGSSSATSVVSFYATSTTGGELTFVDQTASGSEGATCWLQGY